MSAAPPDGPHDTTVPRIAARFRLQFEPAQQAWVLLYPEGMVRLNASAAEILQRCDAQRPVSAIVAELEQTFAQSGLRDDVLGFLRIAKAQQWVTWTPQ